MSCIEIIIAVLNLVVLSTTAFFIILYWKETEKMKRQMVIQTDIANKQLKGSEMPVLDIRFETLREFPHPEGSIAQFFYDVVICNKGNGPAFNISVQRFPSETRGQKEATRNPPRLQLEPFTENINIIGAGEEVKVHRERSDSYRSFTMIIRFRDVFKDSFEWVFEGDRDGVSLKRYDLFKNN